jgi:hypothetical protein
MKFMKNDEYHLLTNEKKYIIIVSFVHFHSFTETNFGALPSWFTKITSWRHELPLNLFVLHQTTFQLLLINVNAVSTSESRLTSRLLNPTAGENVEALKGLFT